MQTGSNTLHPQAHVAETARSPRAHAERNVADGERGVSIAAGAALLGLAWRRGGWTRLASGVAASALVARGVTGHSIVYESLGLDTAARSGRELALARVTTIDVAPEIVRDFWSDASNVPRVLPAVEQAVAIGPDCWRLRTRLPGRRRATFDVDFVEAADRGHVLFRSRPGAPFDHAVRVELSPAPDDRGTQVAVSAELRPPEGSAGSALGRALRRAGEVVLGRALARAKQLLETGEVAAR